MTPEQRTAALRLADALIEHPPNGILKAAALLRELAADVNQSLTTEPDCYGYASRLATGIWEKHYKADSPQWKPLDDTLGVLTQIDNMASGLTRTAEPMQESVACQYAQDVGMPEYRCVGKCQYAAPPQRQPLDYCRVQEIAQARRIGYNELSAALRDYLGIGEANG